MAWAWQTWLSPRPQRRTNTSSESHIFAAGNSARFDFLQDDQGRWVVRETHYKDNPLVQAGRSGPPLHIHFLQNEYFRVLQGTLGVIKNGKEHVVTKADGVLEIPRNTRHRFWAQSPVKEDLVFHIWAEPQDIDHSFDENFLRNFIGYLADCHSAGIQPSFFQVLLLCYNAATILTPPFWMPVWLLRAVHYVLAYWIAAGLLGYKESYPEYIKKAESSSDDEKKRS